MDAAHIIRSKRDGHALTDEEIRWFLSSYLADEVAEEQAAALLMAIVFRGLDQRELDTWTAAMIASGDRLDLRSVTRPTVDKHSTGGVGDKISLPLCPLIAACGAAVPQMAGRGLGHTGGTLDKMESIPGWRAHLTSQEMLSQLERVGAVICAAGAALVPADRRLYALRDVTGTVESIPLIASSIMSKKIAEGTSALVLDVKVGSGAFMKDVASARQLAETMVRLGAAEGVPTTAVLSRMDTPLGRACGNALEVTESVDVLQGGGPADVVELTVTLAREMLALVGLDRGPTAVDPADVLASGAALAVWRAMVSAQGGDPDAPLPVSTERREVRASRTGVVTELGALPVGLAAWRLGAGRARKEHPVSASAGVVCVAKVGEAVEEGQPVLELHLDDPARLDHAMEALEGAITIGDEAPPPAPLVIDVLRP